MADGNVVKRLAGFAVPRWSRRVARRGRAAGGLPLQPARVGSQYWSFIVATAPAMMAAVVIAAWLLCRRFASGGKTGLSFAMSSLAILGLWGIVGATHFPNLVRATGDASLNITMYNASSSELTLKVMLYIALIGMPIVILYTAYVYRVFRGKVMTAK